MFLLIGGYEKTSITQSHKVIRAGYNKRYTESIISTSDIHYLSFIGYSLYMKQKATRTVCIMIEESRRTFDPVTVHTLMHLRIVVSTRLLCYKHRLYMVS